MQQIKKIGTEEVLHEHGETLKECLEHAVINLLSLTGANLRGANLNDANLRGANLNDANLRGANLNGANLNGANLNDANLNGANLNGANLNGAELSGAKLNGANLRGANLGGAELSFAELSGANLGGAEIKTTSFKHADMRHCNRDDDAKIARMDVCEWPVAIQFDGIHIGCKTFTLDEIMGMTEEIAATHSNKAPIRWRRWGKALQELTKATLG